MADQQLTIDYSVGTSGKQPALDVNLVLTYDDATQSKYDQNHGAYKVTQATGTYTETTSTGTTTYDIVGIRNPNHLGNNDDLVYPGGTQNVVDKRGVTFVVADPLPHAPKHVIVVNLFTNPRQGNIYQQYSNYHSRTVSSLTPSSGSSSTIAQSSQTSVLQDTQCFAAGTLIRTARGDVAVEALRVGDLAVTASGALRPIKWLGSRELDLRAHGRPAEMSPVRVAAHAFGPGMPARDLFLSPGHPVLVGADADQEGGCLVPIMCLVNGTTIERVAMARVTYWHVELDGHDILLAEGLPAESYIEYADRTFFAQGNTAPGDDMLANPDLVVPGLAGRCRPVAIDGAVVQAERDRLDCVFAQRLAQACAWPAAATALEF